MRASAYRRYNPRNPKRSKPASRISGRFLYYVTLAFLFLYITVGPYGFWHLFKIKSYKEELYSKVILAEKENTELRNKLVAIKSDRAFQEKLVRTKLGWIKDGEILYKFLQTK